MNAQQAVQYAPMGCVKTLWEATSVHVTKGTRLMICTQPVQVFIVTIELPSPDSHTVMIAPSAPLWRIVK